MNKIRSFARSLPIPIPPPAEHYLYEKRRGQCVQEFSTERLYIQQRRNTPQMHRNTPQMHHKHITHVQTRQRGVRFAFVPHSFSSLQKSR